MIRSIVLARPRVNPRSSTISKTTIRHAPLACVVAFSIAPTLATVTPELSLLSVQADSGPVRQPPCYVSSQLLAIPSPLNSLTALKRKVEAVGTHIPGNNLCSVEDKVTASGSASWKSPYAGKATASLRGAVTINDFEGTEAASTSGMLYSLTTDSPYLLTVDCRMTVSGVPAAGSSSLSVVIDGATEICNVAGGGTDSGSIQLTSGSHSINADFALFLEVPAPQTFVAKLEGSVKWELKGCESRKEIPITEHPYGVIEDFLCEQNEPANLKNEWRDEQSARFRLTCEDSTFQLRYHPDGTDPYLSAAACVWVGGENNANIFVPGDADDDGEYDCFLRSFWINREPGVEEDVPNVKDQCVYSFDVKTRKLKTQHQVLDVLDNKWRPATPGELAASDRCVEGLALALGSEGANTGGVLLCDQHVDGVCDALDNLALLSAIGATVGDVLYDFLLDLDDDGWVLDNDLRSLFPGLDLDGDSVLNATDNCLAVNNAGQADSDSDEHGDACDCAPSSSTTFAVPHEVTELTQDDGSLLWESQEDHSGSSTEYDVLSGTLAELRGGGSAAERCVAAASPITIANDILDPELGEGFYYLIRGRNPCGEGTYGQASSGTPRTSSTCPDD